MRLIDGDALKEILYKYIYYDYYDDGDQILFGDDVFCVLNDMPTIEEVPRWISVKERLPQYGEKVLIKSVHRVSEDTGLLCPGSERNYWAFKHCIPSTLIVEECDYWMPIPEWSDNE